PFRPVSISALNSRGCAQKCAKLERAMGIEPTSEAWEASILPLYDARSSILLIILPSWSRNNRDAQGSDDPDKFHSTFAAPFLACITLRRAYADGRRS